METKPKQKLESLKGQRFKLPDGRSGIVVDVQEFRLALEGWWVILNFDDTGDEMWALEKFYRARPMRAVSQ
jgi:hypothetical protein